MSYSRLNMIDKRNQVFEADNSFQFFMGWIRNLGGKGALYIHLPANYKESALTVCKTVRKLSSRSFSLSSLISYQVDEIIKAQETNKSNLYDLKKSLEQMRYYIPTNANLKRVKIHLSKTVIYELEFLLSNMYEELGKHDMTVEKLLELNLIDMLKSMHRGEQNVIQEILDSLNVSKDRVKEYEENKGEELLA